MKPIFAIVEAGGTGVSGVLAGEALRRAARGQGRSIEIELRTQQGVVNPVMPGNDDMVLFVAPNDHDGAAESLGAIRRLTLEAVLADPEGVLAAASTAESTATGTATAVPDATSPRIVAVTSCPTGIAHTFMAAEGLETGARQLGHVIHVETQGSVGAGNPLTAQAIAEADIVLIAADREVDRSRFAGKRVFTSNTKPAITGGAALITRALAEATMQGASATDPGAGNETGEAAPATPRVGPYKHLMTGVSFMLPFVVAGGLLIALAFALGGINATDDAGTLAHALFLIGAKGGFALIVPVLAGYIAFSIADRPGIAPGMIGGMLAANLEAGFLGGIVAGFIAGYGVAALNRVIVLPRTLMGLKPMLILPMLGTLLTGLLMIYAVGTPVAGALALLTEWLRSMQGTSALALGLILGAMMAFDMGGPVNKAAYAFSVGLIASQVYSPMAAVMAAGMTPPIGMALATKLFPNRFSHEEREAGGAAAILGLAFVSEGAIPFAARDPLRVIPALMAGSAAAGAISMVVGAGLHVPHGGIFVLPIPGAVTHLSGYVLAIVTGAAITAALAGLLKRPFVTVGPISGVS